MTESEAEATKEIKRMKRPSIFPVIYTQIELAFAIIPSDVEAMIFTDGVDVWWWMHQVCYGHSITNDE